MAGTSGLLTSLIMIGVALYVGVNFVLPLAQQAVSGGTGILGDLKGAVGMAGYEGYGDDF